MELSATYLDTLKIVFQTYLQGSGLNLAKFTSDVKVTCIESTGSLYGDVLIKVTGYRDQIEKFFRSKRFDYIETGEKSSGFYVNLSGSNLRNLQILHPLLHTWSLEPQPKDQPERPKLVLDEAVLTAIAPRKTALKTESRNTETRVKSPRTQNVKAQKPKKVESPLTMGRFLKEKGINYLVSLAIKDEVLGECYKVTLYSEKSRTEAISILRTIPELIFVLAVDSGRANQAYAVLVRYRTASDPAWTEPMAEANDNTVVSAPEVQIIAPKSRPSEEEVAQTMQGVATFEFEPSPPFELNPQAKAEVMVFFEFKVNVELGELLSAAFAADALECPTDCTLIGVRLVT